MPFVQRFVEPKYLSRTNLFDEDGNPRVSDDELQAVTNNTLCNALRQLASLVLVADDIFTNLGGQLQSINKRSESVKVKINALEEKVTKFDPKEVTVPESDICSFALLKNHYAAKQQPDVGLFRPETRPAALEALYNAATKTPVHLMRQLDRWRRDGHRTSRFFLCTPVLGAKRRKIRSNVDIDIETRMPAAVEELRRWTSDEALGDVTVTPDCASRIAPTMAIAAVTDGDTTDGTIVSDDEGIDHKLPSPEEQLQVVALRFPAEIVAVDVSGRSFDRMSIQRRSLMHVDPGDKTVDGVASMKRSKTRNRRPRSRRRNTLAGTDQKEIHDALTAGEDEASSPTLNHESEASGAGVVCRSKSTDLLRPMTKKESPESKKSHFNTLKRWGKNRYEKFMNKSTDSKSETAKSRDEDIDDFRIYETVASRKRRDIEKERKSHERNSSISSSDKSSINLPVTNSLSSVINVAVKLRESSAQRRQRRNGSKDEPHSSSGNWSASSESGRASIGSEITSTTHPKSTTSATTSSNSLNHQPSSVNSRRRFNANTSTSSSVTSEGTLTPDIINDLHEDGETSSIYSCDTEGYYTSFHMDSGLKTLKEEDTPPTPLHSSTAFSNSSSNNTVLSAENEYELFGKGSTSTTTSSAGTVCTTLRASGSNKSLPVGPAVPERKSSLSKLSNRSAESSLERDFSDKTGTVKRSPGSTKPALIHKKGQGDVSPDSGHNTSSSPIESISSPNGVRSGSDFEFSESSDMEGPERIERIRVKTTINSSRIPSMCVITPPHSDDESVHSSGSSQKNYQKRLEEKNNLNEKLGSGNITKEEVDMFLGHNVDLQIAGSLHRKIISTNVNGTNRFSLVNVNPMSGYATVEPIDRPASPVAAKKIGINQNTATTAKSVRAPSPSGGTVTVKEEPPSKSPSAQPIIKSSLLPLNHVFGRLKTNLANFAQKRERSRSPVPNRDQEPMDDALLDSGEYVTIADVRNNNEKAAGEVTYANDVINKNLNSVLSGKVRDAEYVSLNELPSTENDNVANVNLDSLERKRQGARVTLDAEGKVVYSSDSLRRRKGAHSTFEPGPHVKPTASPSPSPVPTHRMPKSIRPVANTHNPTLAAPVEFNRPLSPQSGKYVIRASCATAEIIRMPPSTIVAPNTRPMSPKSFNRGAYVHIQDAGRPLSPTQEKERVPSPASSSSNRSLNTNTIPGSSESQSLNTRDMYRYQEPIETDMDNRYLSTQYYLQRGSNLYSTLPSKKTQFFASEYKTERSVTPDITRGLERNHNTQGDYEHLKINYQHSLPRNFYKTDHGLLNQKLGIPVRVPEVDKLNIQNVPLVYPTGDAPTNMRPQNDWRYRYKSQDAKPFDDSDESFKISPIDPRHSRGFQSSTPSSKAIDLKAAINLEDKLMSPKKSTMSNEELYAVIHKSKKRMNIETENTPRSSPVTVGTETPPKQIIKSPETGYLGDKSRSRLSWSPNKGDYVDFNSDIDKLSPPNESRSRQSWACSERKGQKSKQTSTIDFKRLLLQKSSSSTPRKLSAVEQLKLSKQQIKPPQPKTQPEMSILDLSGSPRGLVNRRMLNSVPGSPSRDLKPAPKILSPRSQWRFASPRSDVLSSTILEDCREDETSTSYGEKKQPSPKSDNTFNSNYVNNENLLDDIQNDPRNISILSAAQRLQAQRAQFFNSTPTIEENRSRIQEKPSCPPTLETAF
ncbi:uncharacterized protein LOC108903802 isoform X1 [Anoplophora glabripennis]|nr:uncharacterized protein LOC108903802 isoform X1 [Anoplophora glabripennis]